MTDITTAKLKDMSDDEIINHIENYPYPSMWQDKSALGWVNYHLSLMTGRKYQQTGNIKVFQQASR